MYKIAKPGTAQNSTNRKNGVRAGAAAIMILIMLAVFMIFAALGINYAYMQLVETELRVASDAAAIAGSESLGRTQDQEQAIAAAIHLASLNTVGGNGFVIDRDSIEFGRTVIESSGKWKYQSGGSNINSVKVTASTGDSAPHPAIPLFMGNILGRSSFNPRLESKSGQRILDIVLCLDRSGSMQWDMTGASGSYAQPHPNLVDFTDWGEDWQYRLSPAHPTQSRWAALSSAAGEFFSEMESQGIDPRVSLVTWASDYTLDDPFNETWSAATVDEPFSARPFSEQRDRIVGRIQQLGSSRMMGMTNLAAGIDLAVSHVTGTSGRPFANKIVVVFTDGEHNQGRDPILAAQDARDAGVVLHAVTLLSGTAADNMAVIATTANGRSFSAANTAELRAAFREIARSISVSLID
jgi:Ca-activated chloride channel homolog